MEKMFRLMRRCQKNAHLRKIWMTMKLTIFLFFLAISQIMAIETYSQSTRLSLNLKSVAVKDVLDKIEEKSEFVFLYNSKLIDVDRTVSMDFKNQKIIDVLDKLFLETDVVYTVVDRQIVLTSRADQASFLALGNVQQGTKVSGKVSDSSGAFLPGVSVLVKGTTTGVITDGRGNYSLANIPANATLQFSFIGMKRQEIVVGNKSTIDVVLEEETIGIDEVVAIGYGTVKKSDLTGAISSVSSKDLGVRMKSDIGSLIQGKAAGVDVSQGKIRIRGLTSFTDDSPLIIIDGFAGGNLNAVNANDIENIEILKDASSTAIYGSKGANGVILITTKMGTKGALKFNLGYKEGFANVPKKLDLMNADQYTDYAIEMLNNQGLAVPDKLKSGDTRIDRTDWQDEVFKTGHNRELNFDFSGGSEKATYFLGLGYKHSENPTFLGMATDNFYLRSKNDFNIKDWFRMGNNIALSYNSFAGGGEYGNPGNLDHTINTPTYFPVKNPDGTYSKSDRNNDIVEIANPITTAVHNHVQGTGLNYQVAFYGEVEPIKGLVYRVQASVSGEYNKDQASNDSYSGGIAGDATLPTRLRKTFSFGFHPLIEQYITYKKNIGKHDFSVMAGNLWRSANNGGTIQIFGEGLDLAINSVKTAPTNLATRDEIWKDAGLSYFGRINYQFNNKYLLTANLRSDASPRFAPANRWAKFPSVSLAWKMHEEAFIKNLNIFDQLKLRAGKGTSGSDNIGNFRYLSQVYTLNVYVPFGNDGTRANGATVINNSSSNIRWETTETTSVGADMAFFDNSLTFSADYYQKETRDILYEIPQPLSLGYGDSGSSGSAIVNAASMENKGIELQLGYRSKIGQLNYSINANYTNNKNNVISLGEGSYIDGVNRTDLGHPLGYYYGYVADGIFMKQSELDAANAAAKAKGWATYQDGVTRAGDVRFKDVNGDGHVDDNDRTYLGTPHPKHLFGLNLNLDYKGFDLNVVLQGIGGSEIYDGNYNRQRGGQNILNQFTYVLDRWKSEAEPGNGIVPRVAIGDPARNNRFSTLKLTNGNYLKARQISLGYTIPDAFSNRIGIDNIRIYVTADNYFTFSKWKYGYDPEVGGDNLSRGADGGNNWPNPKLLMLGFQIRL